MKRRTLFAGIALALGSTSSFAQNTNKQVINAAAGASPQLEEISVIGRYVPNEKRSSSAVSSVLSSAEFSRSGDNNIAEGLKRVAGLSLVGGKYVYVRGLGERYSSALLNGSNLPSPEPLNRVVPLDLFPSAIMDSVLVQKTYSAQFSSEFGGGVLQMRTKKSSNDAFFNFSTSVAGTQGTNFSDGWQAGSANKDWLGHDDGSRAMPQLLKQATTNGQRLQRRSQFLDTGGYTAQELAIIGQSFNNNYDLQQDSIPGDFGATMSFGNNHNIGASRLNYIVALDYKNAWDKTEIERNSYKVSGIDELTKQDEFIYHGTDNKVDLSSIVTSTIDFNDQHSMSVTHIALRQANDRAGKEKGFFGDEQLNSSITQIEYVERQLVSTQLEGTHYFPDANELEITWRYNRATADRDAPDTREYRYDDTKQGTLFNLRADGNVRRFSELQDTSTTYALDADMIFYGPHDSTITMSTGYDMQKSARDYSIRRFTFFDLGDVANRKDFLNQPLSQILAQQHINPNDFELRETTRPTDTYAASRTLESRYIQSELNFSEKLRLVAGLRHEDYVQNVSTFDLFRPLDEITGQLTTSDLLPGLTASYIHNNHQFRVAYSETTSRPDFRELSPATFTNPLTGYEVVGNPALKVAAIKNYDLRWEWYFSRSDSLSLGLFKKDFDSPIESVVQPGANSARSYVNATSATNRGIEFEVRRQLDFISDRLSDFYVSGNISHIESEVTIGVEEQNILTNSVRPLQGQSDWLFNGQLGYDNFNGLTATLLYHYFGERIYEVGILGAPDLIEEPHGALDFVLMKEFGERWKLNIKMQNLFDERKEISQGGYIANAYSEGRSASLKLEYRL